MGEDIGALGGLQPLRHAEQFVLQALDAGTPIVDLSGQSTYERTARAKFLSWCLRERVPSVPGHVTIIGLRVEEEVLLSAFESLTRITWRSCTFGGGISLARARLTTWTFADCRLNGLDMTEAVVTERLTISNCQVRGAIVMRALSCAGSVSVVNTAVNSGARPALNCSQARIDGDLLIGGLTATGQLFLTAVEVGGSFSIRNTVVQVVEGTDGIGLSRGHFRGPARIRDVVVWDGVLRIASARLEGNLTLERVAIYGVLLPAGHQEDLVSIVADRITVQENVRLTDVRLHGYVRFHAAVVGGQLAVMSSSLVNPGGGAFSIEGGQVAQGLFLVGNDLVGRLSLVAAYVRHLSVRDISVQVSEGAALIMSGAKVEGGVMLADSALVGLLNGSETTVGGSVRLEDVSVTLPAGTGSPGISLRGSEVRGGIALSSVTVGGAIDLSDAVLRNGVRLTRCTLLGTDGTLVGANLDVTGEMRLTGCDMSGGVMLDRMRLHGDLAIYETVATASEQPYPAVMIMTSVVDGTMMVGDASVLWGGMSLNGTTVTRGCFVRDSALVGARMSLEMQSAQVDGVLFVADSYLAGLIDLHEGQFTRVTLERSVFSAGEGWRLDHADTVPNTVTIAGNFIRVKSAMELKSLTARNAELRLDLRGAAVGSFGLDEVSCESFRLVRLDGFQFDSLLDLPPEGSLRAEWLERRSSWLCRSDQYNAGSYRRYAEVLRNSGSEAASKAIAVAGERDRLRRGGLSLWQRVFGRVLGVTTSYGYRPHWALFWAAGLCVVGTALLYWGRAEAFVVAAESAGRVAEFNAFWLSTDAFLPVIDLGYERAWRLTGRGWLGQALATYYALHILMGWLLTTVGALAITGVIRRDGGS